MGPRKPASDVDEAIGKRISSLRTSSNLSAEEVASSAGMRVQDYSEGERGERRFHAIELHRIAKTLGVDLGQIVSVL
jgi:transcriptional regulator with XRE-family HTH domain